jgi:serine protease Do
MVKSWAPWIFGLTAGALGIAATSHEFDWPWATKVNASQATPILVSDAPLQRDSKFTTSFSPIVKQVVPSVVSVYTSKRITRNQENNPFFNDPFFRQFFGDQYGNRGSGSRRRPYTETSLGSGIIVRKDGYILTNNHVIDGADEIKIALPGPGKREYIAKVVGRDERTDVALLKIDANNLPAMTLADSDKIEVGDVVLAIGNPFGLGQTVTMGIISAVRRSNVGIEDYEDFIQTDAAINPGNSGGALVDGEGRLIGISTAILSRSGGNQGIGFAVPANLARNIMDRLLKTGKVVRGFLGVWMQDVTPALAKALGIPEVHGVVVTDVTEKSAAAEGGVKVRDVITELNGKPVQDGQQLRLAVAQFAPGDKVKLKVLRNKEEKVIEVTLKENPDEKSTASSGNAEESSSESLQGVTVGDIDSASRQQFSLSASLRGALVLEVDPDSAAYEAGLRVGDVIQEINQKPVKSADEAVTATKNLKEKEILLRVWSRGGSHYLVVDESKKK